VIAALRVNRNVMLPDLDAAHDHEQQQAMHGVPCVLEDTVALLQR